MRSAMRAASQISERGMMLLHLHVNQNAADDDDERRKTAVQYQHS